MDVLTTKEDGVLTIELNRPAKKNAITVAMYQMMADAIRDGEEDESVRVLLFCGGPEGFCAGNDLADFTEDNDDQPVEMFMRRLMLAAKPVIAAVTGAAVGIGTTMLLHCDQVYAAEDAKFAMPFVKLGLCPEFGSSLLLPQIVGYHRAAGLLFFGEFFSAQEAFDMGLVSRILPPADLLPYAYAQAAKLVAMPPPSLRTSKSLMKASTYDAVLARLAEEEEQFNALLKGPEAKQALAVFLERR